MLSGLEVSGRLLLGRSRVCALFPDQPGARRIYFSNCIGCSPLIKDKTAKAQLNGGTDQSPVNVRWLLRGRQRRGNDDAGRADRYGRCQGGRFGYCSFWKWELPETEAEQCIVVVSNRRWRRQQSRQVGTCGVFRNFWRSEAAPAEAAYISIRDGNGAVLHPRRSSHR